MTKEVFERLLIEKQYKAIKSIFDTMNPVDTALLLPEFEDKQMVMPGDNVELTVDLIYPIAMEKGLRFAIREGGKTVASGQVTEVIE